MLSRAELLNYCLTKSCLERQGLPVGGERPSPEPDKARRGESRSAGR